MTSIFIQKECTYGCPDDLVGKDHPRSMDEWIVVARIINGQAWQDEEHILKMFFDNEYEARRYKEEIEKLVSTVIRLERERVSKKLKETLGL